MSKFYPQTGEGMHEWSDEEHIDSFARKTNCKPACPQKNLPDRLCPPIELVQNGGFEERGVLETFAAWEQSTSNMTIQASETAYEENFSASFASVATAQVATKTATLSQNVPVTPGCFLALSFAENFLAGGTAIEDLNIRARVFYGTGVNLINIEIDHDAALANQGFAFHQRVSNNPVPPNVTSVTVEFFVQVRDLGPGTQWLLDGVSLRAV